MYITDLNEWANRCLSDPIWLGRCLQRISRFGGQHPTSNVLIHSLQVAHGLRYEKPRTQLWALMHDAHEVLSGDVTRLFKTPGLSQRQSEADEALHYRLGITQEDIAIVHREDVVCGDAERKHWDTIHWHYAGHECVSVFDIRVRSLLAVVDVQSERLSA